MSDHDYRSFNDLPCPACGGVYFVSLVRLRHKAGGGLVPDPCGYACLGCQTVTDAAKALQAYQLKIKREELENLEKELGVHDVVSRNAP